jgi:hypothetical protein
MEHCSPSDVTTRPALDQVRVRPVLPSEKERWDALMRAHHYLGFAGFIGQSLRYVAEADGRWLALVGWQAAALKCRARDHWIGWPPVLQYRRLHLIANNSRFLILPDAHHSNLASRVLSLNLKRLSADWQAVHGTPLLLAETFVDPERFTGACYKAANWLVLGLTRGFAKQQQTYRQHGSPKLVLVYPLHRRTRDWLVAPNWQPRSAKMNPKALTTTQLENLRQLLKSLPDCRQPRGVRHRYWTVLTIALAGVLCGAKSFLALGEYADQLTQAQLLRLGARFNKRTGRHAAPTESTLRRVLQASDADALDRALGGWLFEQAGAPRAIAVDGKTLRGARRPDGSQVHLLSAFLHQQGATIAQIEVGAKTNEIPEIKRLLEPLNISGVVVTGDALHTQKETARFIVEDKKADYLFTVKANQPTLLDDLAALDESDFSPGVPNGG